MFLRVLGRVCVGQRGVGGSSHGDISGCDDISFIMRQEKKKQV